MPQAVFKAEAIFNSWLSDGTLKHKVPGHKLTLVSDYGHNVVVDRDTNKVVTTDDLDRKSNNSISKAIAKDGGKKYVSRRFT
jgi:hypothetical protein